MFSRKQIEDTMAPWCGMHHDDFPMWCKNKILFIEVARTSDNVNTSVGALAIRNCGYLHLSSIYGRSYNKKTKNSWKEC